MARTRLSHPLTHVEPRPEGQSVWLSDIKETHDTPRPQRPLTHPAPRFSDRTRGRPRVRPLRDSHPGLGTCRRREQAAAERLRRAAPSGPAQPRGTRHAKPDAGFAALTPAAGADPLVEKLGDSDARLFQKAEARGDETVTVLLAATPGETDRVTATVTKAGGSLGRTEEDLGYVRATVPVDAVRDLAALGDVRAIDLNRSYRIPDPRPAGAAPVAARRRRRHPAPRTPADNPYLPVGEIGATDFVDDHRTWDGRGDHRRRPGQRRRPRPPRAPDHHERQAEGGRLVHGHRPDRRRRRVLACR